MAYSWQSIHHWYENDARGGTGWLLFGLFLYIQMTEYSFKSIKNAIQVLYCSLHRCLYSNSTADNNLFPVTAIKGKYWKRNNNNKSKGDEIRRIGKNYHIDYIHAIQVHHQNQHCLWVHIGLVQVLRCCSWILQGEWATKGANCGERWWLEMGRDCLWGMWLWGCYYW